MPSATENQNRFKATIHHALSDSIRLEILDYLRDGEKCVCEIMPHLGLVQPLVSRHLKILKDAGVVSFRKDGTKRMYAIVDKRIFNAIDALTPELMSGLTKAKLENIIR